MMIIKGTRMVNLTTTKTNDAHLGFYHTRMHQWYACNKRIVFKMAYAKIRLTRHDFELYVSAPINTQGILLSVPHMQITGNKISGTTAGINIGGVSP